jgi:hypothetical protein
LELGLADLKALRQAIEEVADTPGIHPYERFVLIMACPTGTSVDPTDALEPLPLLASVS